MLLSISSRYPGYLFNRKLCRILICFLGFFILAIPCIMLAEDGMEDRYSFEENWSIELGSGVLFANVPSKTEGYTLVPAELTAAFVLEKGLLKNDLNGILQGNLEFLFRGFGIAVTHGPESRILGVAFGPRYTLIQPSWRIAPFFEATGGFAFADSQGRFQAGEPVGLGQDFNFVLGGAVGARYDINDAWFASLSAVYRHFSSLGLSEPERRDNGIHAIGPEMSLGCRF